MFDKKIKNVLKKETVIIRYLPDFSKYSGNHILKGGLHKDCGTTLTIRRINGRISNTLLTNEELESLKFHGNLPELSLSNEDFWRNKNLEIKLTSKDFRLNMDDPIHYIIYKNLFQAPYNSLVAPNLESIHNEATYRWVIIRDNEDEDASTHEINLKTEAYTLFGKYNNDTKILSYIYNKIEGKVISEDTKKSTVVSWFKNILQDKTSQFLKIAKDELLEEKVLIYHAVRAGIISMKERIYYYGEIRLSEDPRSSSLDEAAKFISLPRNNDIKLEIEAKLNNE